MTDIGISVGLQTQDALKASKELEGSLENVVAALEKIQKENKEAGSSSKKQGKETDSLARKSDALLKKYDKIGTAQKKLAKDRETLNRAVKAGSVTTAQATKIANGLADAQNRLAGKTDKTTGAQKRQSAQLTQTNGLWQAAKRVALAYIGINTAKSIVNTVSAFDALRASLKVVSGSQAGEQMQFITDTALRLGLSITDVGKEFVKLTAAANETTIQGRGVRDIFTQVSESARALNLSADDTKGAFRAITQIMSKGTVQAEELRGQLGERFPGAFQIAARAMGKTTGELNKMLEQGQVLSEDFIPKFTRQLGIDIPIAAESLNTVSANFGKLTANTELLIDVMGKNGLADALKEVSESLAEFTKSKEAIQLAKDLGEALKLLGKAVAFFIRNWEILLSALVAKAVFSMVGALVALGTSFTAAGAAALGMSRGVAVLGTAMRVAFPFIGAILLGLEGLKLLAQTEIGKSFIDMITGNNDELREKQRLIEKINESLIDARDAISKGNIAIAGVEELKQDSLDINLDTAGLADVQVLINKTKDSMDALSAAALGSREQFNAMTAEQIAATGGFEAQANRVGFLAEKYGALEQILERLQSVQSFIGDRTDIDAQITDIEKMSDALEKSKKNRLADARVLAKSGELLDGQQKKLDKLLKKIDEQIKKEKKKAALVKDTKLLNSLKDKVKVTQLQSKATKESARQAFILQQVNKVSDKENISLIKSVSEQAAAYWDLVDAQKEVIDREKQLKDLRKGVDDLTDASDKLGESWLSIGDNMEGAFGGVVDQLNALGKQHKEYINGLDALDDKADEIAIKREDGIITEQQALTETTAVEKSKGKLEEKNANAKLGQLSSIFAATAEGFKEGSSAAKAMTIISQGLAVAQAVSAVANQGQGDPYTSFARIAAMISTMASLGLSVGGGGGSSAPPISEQRQAAQGTGTVLGDADAKSESIINALERLESVDLDQFTELRGIFREMVSLNNNISRFAASVVRGFGDFSSGDAFGVKEGTTRSTSAFLLWGHLGTTTEIIDSGIKFVSQTIGDVISGGISAVAFADVKKKKKRLFGLLTSTSTRRETTGLESSTTNTLTDIFISMGDAITDAMDILGIDAVNALETFVINIGEVSFKDMTGDEIQAELEAIFSQQGDLMAQHVLPSLAAFQEVGEGLFETLIRVAHETAVFEQGLKLIGVGLAQFSDLSGTQFLIMSQEAIDAAGGMEAYQEAVVKFADVVLSGSQVLALAASNAMRLADVELVDVGLTTNDIGSVDEFRDAFEAIKNTLSPTEIVEWVQAGNALADLDKAMQDFEDTVSDMLKPFQDLRKDIADTIEGIQGDTRTSAGTFERFIAAREEVDRLVGDNRPVAFNDLKNTKPPTSSLITAATAEDQLAALTELRDAILDRYDFELSLIQKEQEATQALLDTALEFASAVGDVRENVLGSVVTLTELATGFDAAAARIADVQGLQAQLSDGILKTREDELKLLDKLQSAIMDSFSAQGDAIRKNASDSRLAASSERDSLVDRAALREEQESSLSELQERLAALQMDIQQEAFDASMEMFEAWRDVAKDLTSFLADMQLSEFSPLTNQERLDFSAGQFSELVQKAQSGDVEAAAGLGDAAQSYLSEARDFFASGDEFNRIFNAVQSQITGVRDIAEAVSAPAELSVGDAAIVDTIASVTAEINALTAVMEPLSTIELQAAMAVQDELLVRIGVDETNALELLRVDTLTQLQSVDAQLATLNDITQSRILTHQDDLQALTESANVLAAMTVQQLQSLNTLIEDLEDARENSMRESFDSLIESNNTNTDRIVDAINNGGVTAAGSEGTVDGESTFDNGFDTFDFRLWSKMSDSLDNIDSTLSGGGGGAIIQQPAQSIETI